MPFVLVILGAVLLVAAFNNTQSDLGAALQQDVPPFVKWALAIAAVGALGWVPGMRTLSRWMTGLVLVVIVLANWQAFQQLASNVSSGVLPTGATGTPAPTPAAAIVANPAAPSVTLADITGSSSYANSINAANQIPLVPQSMFDPSAFLAEFESGVGGFGGVA